MGETYALQEPDRGDYETPEAKEKTRDNVQDKDETSKGFTPEWYSRMPRELADQAITRGVICQYMLLMT